MGRRRIRLPPPLRQWLSSVSRFPPGILGKSNAPATRYGLMAASWITFAHFGMSALIRALNSSGGTAEGSYPIAAILSLGSGDATGRAIAPYKRSMISRGVPAGAQTHCGASCSWPGTPASSIVGTSGRITIRFVLVTASARSRPSLICADADGSVASSTIRLMQQRRGGLHFAALDKVDRRIEHHLIAPLHARVHFYPHPPTPPPSHLSHSPPA